MTSFTVENVDEALPMLIQVLDGSGGIDDSRNGQVISLYRPMSVTYRYPAERFVMNPIRKNNVAFLVMEGLWMLAGRRDVEWLARFNEQMREYSDDGKTFHGAYGFRLRSKGIDQLNECAKLLKNDPADRRAVAQIWDMHIDLDQPGCKDLPCNDLIMFRVLNGKELDMTVCNRSNDLIWGMCGANAAHFSMIHEYVAAKAGYTQGRYTQFSNNLHMYLNTPRLDELRKMGSLNENWYSERKRHLVPLVSGDINTFDRELKTFMAATEETRVLTYRFREPFFETVAKPLFNYWIIRKYFPERGDVYKHNVMEIADDAVRNLAISWIAGTGK